MAKAFIFLLTPAERRALKIMAMVENKTMADFSRRAIQEAWVRHFPHRALGEIEDKRAVDNKHKHSEKQDD